MTDQVHRIDSLENRGSDADTSTPSAQRNQEAYGRLPLRCGADMSGFMAWAYRLDHEGNFRIDPAVDSLSFDHAVVQFCADCDPVFRARAEIAGTCDFAAIVARLDFPPSPDDTRAA
ncbi:MAG: hypothetical protein R3C39_10645 [Dehalococcoidia bacterium]